MCREVSKKSRIPRRRATRMISRNVGPAEVAMEVTRGYKVQSSIVLH
jgi:hypothetical protein